MPQDDSAPPGSDAQNEPATERTAYERSAQLLNEIVEAAHPLMAEALYCAAVPHFYGLPLFTAVRHRDDGRNEGLIPRLANYSFVIPLASTEELTYRVRNSERKALNELWIAKDLPAYTAAHQRAMHYWANSAKVDEVLQEQECLYHLFFVNLTEANAKLVRLFRKYYNEHHLAAIEHLLQLGAEALEHLTLLRADIDPAALTRLQQMLMHLAARFAQLQGDWTKSQGLLNQLRHQEALDPQLAPYADRAYGNALAHTGQFVEAIDQLAKAVDAFSEQIKKGVDVETAETERALTMIDLGETYLRFAQSARGYTQKEPLASGLWGQVQSAFFFIISVPLIIYLSFFLGWRVWHPRFWPTLYNLDWIIARLFATGAYYFQRADPVLERSGSLAEGIVADERLAQLYLTMGDAAQAANQFARLLQNDAATLGDYRRAVVQVGLAEAYLAIEHAHDALHLLQDAIPMLEIYADAAAETRAALLGEALLLTGSSAAGLDEFAAAIAAYAAQEQWLAATDVAERLDAVVESRLDAMPEGPTQMAAAILTAQADAISSSLARRLYAVRYNHPLLSMFRRLVALLLPLAVVFTLLIAVGLDSDVSLAPNIEFRATPVLDPQATALRQLTFSQGVTSATLAIDPNPRAALPLLLSIITGYLGFSLLVGVGVIAYTPLRTIQRRDSGIVQLDAEGLTEGEGEGKQRVLWADVTRMIKADTCIWRLPIPASSSFGLETADERMVIGASANWYPAMRRRVQAAIPATAQVLDLDYSIGRSRLAVVYGLNLLLLLAVAFIAWISPRSPLLWQRAPFTVYRLADIYPYLFMGLVVIPLWWGVVRPLRIVRYLGRYGRIAWGMISGALLLVILQVVLLFRPLLTVPDIYPPLICAVALISAAYTIWNVQVAGRRIFPAWVRWGLTLLVTLICALMVNLVWRETVAYHWLVKGTTLRDRVQQSGLSGSSSSALLLQALDAFQRSEQQSRQPLWGIFNTDGAIDRTFGIPGRNNMTRVIALKNAAALSAQLEQGDKSIRLYDELLNIIDQEKVDQVYAWRAMARQSANTSDAQEGPKISSLRVADETSYAVTTNKSAYELSLDDYDAAIRLNPADPRYYLWRGVTHHALGHLDAAMTDYAKVLEDELNARAATKERALTGTGWIYYDRRQYAEAAERFTQATEMLPAKASAWLGLGYAEYAQNELDAAEAAWEESARLDDKDPVVRISLGTLHWKRGGQSTTEEARCAEYARAVDYLTAATDRAHLREQTDADVAFTFRTRAQIEWLLRRCPQAGGLAPGLKSAIVSYSAAITLAPQNAVYWQMRGRITYVLYSELLAQGDPQANVQLLSGLADLAKALELDPVENVAKDYKPNGWLQAPYQPAVSRAAHQALQSGDERQAVVIYHALINAAAPAPNGQAILQHTLDELVGFLARNPQIEGDAARAVLDEAIAE
ncbi:MAG: tetratricopeptide repeat protein [Caldilineaceae bacterium]